MSLCSPYFRALFTSRINGHQPSREYTIPGISTDMLSLVIDFTYTGKTGVTEENVTSLLPTADQFCVARMVQDCANFLIEKMNSENCIGIRQLARNYFVLELDKAAHKYLISNFEEIVDQSEEFLELSLEDVMDLLNSDRINVRKEERVWEAGIKWIDHRPDERKQYIDSILRCIRLGLLDRQYFIENIHVHPYLENNEACKDIVRETLEFWCDFDTIIQKEDEVRMPFLATPRIPHSILFAFGGWSGGSPTNLIETFDTKADRWINIEEVDPVGPRAYHKLAVIGTDIYIIGGFNGNQYFNSCRRFNAVTREWKEVAPMHTKRCYVSVACLNNIIYALGGYDGYYRQNSAERYSSETNQWTFIAPMNLQRSDASATTLNGLIYIVGGFNGIECLSTAEYYCPMFNQWTLVTGMNQRRSGVSIIAHHGHIYVLGGFNGESRHLNGEKYNPTTNEWSPIPDMLKARSNFAIEVTDDKIFVIGGFNGLSTIGNVECYDDREELWCPATTMCAFRSALAACVISGLPNVDDYIYKQRWNLLEERRQKLLQQQAINTAMARQLAFLSDEESAEDEENME
nr:kelch-like protein 10 [Parasteatoda tepidariorum]